MQAPRDTIFMAPGSDAEPFRFDDQVAAVFADMISRSVPGYELTLGMIGVLAAHFGRDGSTCFDLGCSLGASTLAMREQLSPRCRIIAVDNSPAMAARCRQNNRRSEDKPQVDVVCADILDVAISDASLVTLNFTLQFIPRDQRLTLLRRIHQGLNAGGALVLSEKIALPAPGEQALFEQLHHDFKHAMGYSRLEIARKRTALDRVLVPDTIETHRNRLQQAGFQTIHTWFQCFNFVSLLALK